MELRLDITKSLWENIQPLHERLKKLKKKRERLLKLIEEEKNKPVEEKPQEKLVIKKKRKKEWYEAFRWMFTSGGKLVIGGRDVRTNEMLIRRYLEERDLVFHADVVGAPTVLLKNGVDASKEEIEEVARFAASYSRAWRMGLHRVPVFYVNASQVSLAPPSGEYRPKGGLIVKGKRNWLETELYLYLGFKDERFFVSAVKREGVRFLLTPGGDDRLKKAREILSDLKLDKSYLNELVPLLPPGGLRVERVV
jgi:predicted ribosome quality control (RQC) complex YloA/Tae2 family protein